MAGRWDRGRTRRRPAFGPAAAIPALISAQKSGHFFVQATLTVSEAGGEKAGDRTAREADPARRFSLAPPIVEEDNAAELSDGNSLHLRRCAMASKVIGVYSTMPQPITTMAQYYGALLSQKWQTDYGKALRKASQNKKAVLAAFVGLSWCVPCQQLEAEVFKTFKFLAWAYGRVVLLQLDYPFYENQWDTKKKQLFEQYGVMGFPSILGLDAQGNELGRVVGYLSGSGPTDWIDSFESATGLA
jgi:thiol-disulfide isomerase/thioredoxin